LEEFNQKIGLNKLVVWHLNDSRDPFASGRDRHENIGQGTIGQEEFRLIINHPQLKLLPFIIETPGFVGQGPDKKNLDILKGLRQ
jgi:deoxyribonuclease-4